MPLRCVDPDGQSIHSFDLSADQWQRLKIENRKSRHLRMPCCSSQVVLRKSHLGTSHFGHKALGPCTTAPETEAHLRLKRMAITAARANGWAADTEALGSASSGERWTADVLAQKGKHKIAIEIQWSSQTSEETLHRQERYRKSGVRGLWLLRQPGFPVTHELPAVCIGGSLEEDFTALIPSREYVNARHRHNLIGWHQIVPMKLLLERFQFGVPLNSDATVSIHGSEETCWHPSCQAQTRVLTSIDVAFGPNTSCFSVSELGEYPELLRSVLSQLPSDLEIGKIKPRFSKNQGRSYMSNGCIRCDRLFGAFFEGTDARHKQENLHAYPIRISHQWKYAIERHDDYNAAWSVYAT